MNFLLFSFPVLRHGITLFDFCVSHLPAGNSHKKNGGRGEGGGDQGDLGNRKCIT